MPGPDETMHATTVALNGRAVLIRGASGSGKSALGLQLLGLGAALVADDRTRLWRVGAQVMADAPDTIRGRIEARGVGILNAPACGPQAVALIVDLDRVEEVRLPPMRQAALLGVTLPLLHKIETAYFPAAIRLYLLHGREA